MDDAISTIPAEDAVNDRDAKRQATGHTPRPSGDSMLQRAVDAIHSRASIACVVRQQGEMFDSSLIGRGIYLQQGRGDELLVRFASQIQFAGQESSILQVLDGRYLWTDRRQHDERSVTRINQRRVRSALRDADLSAPSTEMAAAGGLAKLLTSLASNFQFGPPTEHRLGQRPVYRLQGIWRRSQFASMAGNSTTLMKKDPHRSPVGTSDGSSTGDPEQPPEHVPEKILLLLGRDNLFPYIIEYQRIQSTQRAGEDLSQEELRRDDHGHAVRTTLRIELFEVLFDKSIDSRRFVYHPGDVDFEDKTEQYLNRNLPWLDNLP